MIWDNGYNDNLEFALEPEPKEETKPAEEWPPGHYYSCYTCGEQVVQGSESLFHRQIYEYKNCRDGRKTRPSEVRRYLITFCKFCWHKRVNKT
jgi:hypothetical protein